MANQDFTGHILGQYELRELLGVGGMGAVYRARQITLDREVAVKVLSSQFASETGYVERFYREARTAAALEHTHIVPIHDYGVQGDLSYVVMRLLTGGSLHDRLQQRDGGKQLLPSLGEIVHLLRQIASALDYAHSQGVIHRDVKPSNVMFDNQGNAYLVDFGIAKMLESTHSLTATGMAMGTPSYMPPEQWRAEDLTPAADQYALGVMIYALITGRVPFEASTPYGLMHKHLNEVPTPPQSFRADIPGDVTLVLERAMAKRAEDRFPSVTGFAQAFERAIGSQGGEATSFFTFHLPPRPKLAGHTPSSFPVRTARPIYRHPAMWVAVALIVALLGVLGFLVLDRSGKNDELSAGVTKVGIPPTLNANLQIVETIVPTVTLLPPNTETPSNTPPPTVTLRPSPTITPSPTLTATSTPAPTATKTATYTATATQTSTIDPLEAARATRNALATQTATIWTATPTPDRDATISAALTVLFHDDQTATATLWTMTPTATATATFTLTPTLTWTPLPTSTLTSTPTATRTLTLTMKPPPTVTVSPTLPNIPLPTVAPDPWVVAMAGVTRNEDWSPVIQNFGGIDMVLVPAGEFMMGSSAAEIDEAVRLCGQTFDSCERVWFQDEPLQSREFERPFWIDRTEVTRTMYQQCVDVGACQSPPNPAYAVSGDQPITRVTWQQAQDFCEWRGATLPNEAEWEYAARGPDHLIFPWGNSFDGHRLNYCDAGCSEIWADGRVNDGYGSGPAPVGTYRAGMSWVGALDMSGNVYEWVDVDGSAGLRGGSYTINAGFVRTAVRVNFSNAVEQSDWGFRCIQRSEEASVPIVPTPGSVELARRFSGDNRDWTPDVQEFSGVQMALVPAGCFMMGSNDGDSDERPAHRVCFDEPYWIDLTEVTNGQFAAFNGEAAQYSEYSGDNRPRESITWAEAQAFCALRGARLPTEAEWEYAARGPDALTYPWGNSFASENVAWEANSNSQAVPVGSKPGGASWVGALDMSGGVWEWVADWYDPDYYATLPEGVVNPLGPVSGSGHLLRGGSWYDYEPDMLRAAYRGESIPGVWSNYGFRCVRSASNSESNSVSGSEVLRIGGMATIHTTDNDVLNVRREPGTANAPVGVLRDGAVVQIIGGPQHNAP